jgi:Tol biopolymer transport system component
MPQRLPSLSQILLLLLSLLLAGCGGRAAGKSSGAAQPCGAATKAPTLPGRLLETGTTTLDLLAGGRRTPIACVRDTPQYFGHPAFSPDGRRVAFVLSTSPTAGMSDWGDDIYIANADGSAAKPVVKRDAAGALITSLVWSPDGSALIYGYFRAVYSATGSVTDVIYQVRRIDLATGTVTELIDNAAQASLSWDGRQMVYVTYPTKDLNITALAMANVDGSGAHTILPSLTGFQSFFEPHLSPDGRQLVFAAVGGPVGRAPAPIAAGPRALLLRIARLAGAEPAAADGSPYEVWVVNLDGSGLHPVANLREDLPYPLWSSDGKQILFLGAAALYLAQADGSSVRQVDRGIAHGQIDWYQGPAG